MIPAVEDRSADSATLSTSARAAGDRVASDTIRGMAWGTRAGRLPCQGCSWAGGAAGMGADRAGSATAAGRSDMAVFSWKGGE